MYLVVVAHDVPAGLNHEPRGDAVGGEEVGGDVVGAGLGSLCGKLPHLRPERAKNSRVAQPKTRENPHETGTAKRHTRRHT